MSSAGASPQYYGITTLVPVEWKAAGLSYAVTRPEQGGTAEWYLCACRSHEDALTIVHNLNLANRWRCADEAVGNVA